jgi:hypothetical protein
VSSRKTGDDDEPYDHGKDTEEFFQTTKEFYEAIKIDSTIITTYEITGVSKVIFFLFFGMHCTLIAFTFG